MNDAVTIIVGAGAVLDLDHKGIFPSVKNITDEVLKLNIQKVDGGERPFLRELYTSSASTPPIVRQSSTRSTAYATSNVACSCFDGGSETVTPPPSSYTPSAQTMPVSLLPS